MFLLVPWYYYGFYEAFGHYLLFNFVFSYGYAFIFAVNHWTQEAGHVDYNNISMSNWGRLQVENSSNFSSLSPLAVHLSGGLNLQVDYTSHIDRASSVPWVLSHASSLNPEHREGDVRGVRNPVLQLPFVLGGGAEPLQSTERFINMSLINK